MTFPFFNPRNRSLLGSGIALVEARSGPNVYSSRQN